MDSVNRWFDRLPRTRFGRASREVSAFRVCGTVGYYGAVLVTLAGGLLTGRSLLVLAVLSVVAAASFFGYVCVRKWITGRETMVQLDQVWLAELCMAGALWVLGQPLLPYLDVVSVGICVFLAGGRVGCLLVGCCHGRPSSIGITYGEEHARDGFPAHLVGVRLFPVPLVEAAGLGLIGLSGFIALPFAAPGRVFMWVLLAYAILRFGVEGLRGDARPHFLGLSKARWMSLAELSLVVWLAQREWGYRIDERGLILFFGLLGTLAVALAVRRAFDPRLAFVADEHVRELAGLIRVERDRVRSNHQPAAEAPVLHTSSRGLAVAVSHGPPEIPASLHISLSLPVDVRDLSLLCELAARACPGLTPDTSLVSREAVLHMVIAHDDSDLLPNDGQGLANRLYGAVVRRQQAGQAVSESRPDPIVSRTTYFGAPTSGPGPASARR